MFCALGFFPWEWKEVFGSVNVFDTSHHFGDGEDEPAGVDVLCALSFLVASDYEIDVTIREVVESGVVGDSYFAHEDFIDLVSG